MLPCGPRGVAGPESEGSHARPPPLPGITRGSGRVGGEGPTLPGELKVSVGRIRNTEAPTPAPPRTLCPTYCFSERQLLERNDSALWTDGMCWAPWGSQQPLA